MSIPKHYWLIVGAIAIVVAVALMLVPAEEQPSDAAAPASRATSRAPEPTPEPRPVRPEIPERPPQPAPAADPKAQAAAQPAPEPPPELPPLGESDAFVQKRGAAIGESEAIERWFSQQELVRKGAMVIESVSQGRIPRKALGFLAPTDKFSVVERGDALYVDPKSYERFDRFARAVNTVDATRAVSLLRLIDPLLKEAYAELGIQAPNVDARVAEAIDMLLETPMVEGPIKLQRPSVAYEFANPELEALPSVQKQLIRMGPENMRTIKAKLRRMREQLDTG